MDKNWDLTPLYPSLESKEFLEALETFKGYKDKFEALANRIHTASPLEILEGYVNTCNEFNDLSSTLSSYVSLILSVETTHPIANKYSDQIDQIYTTFVLPITIIEDYISHLDCLDEVIESSELLKAHEYVLKELKVFSKYTLSPKEEEMLANMKNTGSNAWSKLKDQTISCHKVELNGKEYPLTFVLNMAYDKDASVRKDAYEAEIKSYAKIEQVIAACLNGIKGEVLTENKIRGYNSPIEKTLLQSRMSQKTLDTMLEAIVDSLPKFRSYLKAKANKLGYTNGLPFYELYAPVVDNVEEYDYQKGSEYVVKQFSTFSSHLGEFAKKAIDNHWIDVEPKEGKVGGAFCNNLHGIKQSRFLLNYGDTFSDVVTMAHELGHGFHGECLMQETAMNSSYPMPIAETASTFCETVIKKAALKDASKEEALAILEEEISGCTQVVVDIYSRFLFEKGVFEKREHGALTVDEIKQLMSDAQLASYGDGLDPEYLHPYMWTWKPHYYYAGLNFYNFPYAFGMLLAKGLYALYQQQGPSFASVYEEFLANTGKMSLEDVASSVGIDLTSIDFWKASLKTIEEDIDTFIELVSK